MRINAFSSTISFKNSHNISTKDKYGQSKGTKIAENVNPFGIPLLHRSLEKRLFDDSRKTNENVDLKSAIQDLSTFNINVEDVENGKNMINK